MGLRSAGWIAMHLVAVGSWGTISAQGNMEMKKPAADPSVSLTITVDGRTTTFSLADLSKMTQKAVKVHNEHTKADETYTGVELSDLLTKAGFSVSMATHREMLRSYVQAEGTDKYWVIYSLTEVEPTEHEGDVLVATSMNGKPLGADGQMKLISTEDKKPQRWVRNLSEISVKTVE